MSGVRTGSNNEKLQAVLGGARYDKFRSAFVFRDAERILVAQRADDLPPAQAWELPSVSWFFCDLFDRDFIADEHEVVAELTGIVPERVSLVRVGEHAADGWSYVLLYFAVEMPALRYRIDDDRHRESRWMPRSDARELVALDADRLVLEQLELLQPIAG